VILLYCSYNVRLVCPGGLAIKCQWCVLSLNGLLARSSVTDTFSPLLYNLWLVTARALRLISWAGKVTDGVLYNVTVGYI